MIVSNQPTREEVLASIVANSDQVNAEDLLTGPQTFTIADVRRGTKEQPIQIHLSETTKQFRPCKSMRRVLIAAWGDDPKNFIGQKITLFCDKDIVYAGIKVGGVRISHLSGIDGPKTFLLTQTRGKKAEVTILPIATLSADDAKYVAEVLAEIKTATEDAMKTIGASVAKRSPAVGDAVRAAYKARVAELKAAKDSTP